MRYFCNALMWQLRRKMPRAPTLLQSSSVHLLVCTSKCTSKLIWVGGLGFRVGLDKSCGLWSVCSDHPNPKEWKAYTNIMSSTQVTLLTAYAVHNPGTVHLRAPAGGRRRGLSTSWRPWCPRVIPGSQVLGPRTGYPLLPAPPT